MGIRAAASVPSGSRRDGVGGASVVRGLRLRGSRPVPLRRPSPRLSVGSSAAAPRRSSGCGSRLPGVPSSSSSGTVGTATDERCGAASGPALRRVCRRKGTPPGPLREAVPFPFTSFANDVGCRALARSGALSLCTLSCCLSGSLSFRGQLSLRQVPRASSSCRGSRPPSRTCRGSP